MSTRIRVSSLVAFFFFCAALPLGAQDDFVFTTIVDPDTPVPGGVGTFSPLLPFGSIAMDGREVVFVGRSSDRRGIYWYRQGNLERVADTTMLFPGTADTFNGFDSTAIDRGEIAFSAGSGGQGAEGVFFDDGSGLQAIVDHTDSIPNTATLFTEFGQVDLHRGELAFGGGDQNFGLVTHQAGLYGTAGGLQTLFDQSDAIPPGGMGTFPAFENIAFDDDGLAFTVPRVGSSLLDGIYEDVGAGAAVVADLTTPIPGGSGNFEDFRRMDYGDGVVAFIGSGSGGQLGAYAEENGLLTVIADTSTPVPGGGSFSGPTNIATSDGNVAFVGSGPGLFGLFAMIDGVLLEVVRRGDSFDGRTVDQVAIHRGGMDGRTIAFDVLFTDDTSGIYLAELPMFGDGFESGNTSAWPVVQSGTEAARDHGGPNIP